MVRLLSRRAAFISFFSHHHLHNKSLIDVSSSHRQIISSSSQLKSRRMSSMTNNYDDKEQSMGHHPPLVDVDCNLLHSDLMSVMDSISSINVDDKEMEDAFKILHHPSTMGSNIVGMVSPSSTISESEKSVQLLESCTDEQRNHICIKTSVGVHPVSLPCICISIFLHILFSIMVILSLTYITYYIDTELC